MENRVFLGGVAGAGIGSIQTPLIREYIDKKYPDKTITALGGFGTPSALAGLIGGAVALIAGAYGNSRRRMSDTAVIALGDYGAAAMSGGLVSGLLPVSEGLTPQVQQASMSAIQRLSQEVQRLSQENVQLRTQSPRVQAMQQPAIITSMQPLPGHVGGLQRKYGFMEGRNELAPQHLQGAPGQPTRRMKSFGFMASDGTTGTATSAVRAMKERFDFLG